MLLLLRARLGLEQRSHRPGELNLDGSPVPLGSTATHEPTEIPKSLWARRKYLNATNKHELMRIII
jgi:hypothetical protein